MDTKTFEPGSGDQAQLAPAVPPLLNDNLDPALLAGVDVRALTDAPLKMLGVFELNCGPDVLWPLISTASGIATWFPIISGGRHDNSTSQTSSACDVGAKRYCQTIGMGVLDETILHWDPPRAYAYNVKNLMMPIRDHVAVMIVDPISPNHTRFVWLQYYRYKGLLMRHVFPTIMLTSMNIGLKSLIKKIGGGRIIQKMHLI
ncbi:MAG: hypothetical protein Tsb0016_05330 [Sphingomonadales bacterium]